MDKTIENNVWKYIRRKRFFIFSDVIMVTKVTQEYLLQLLAQYEARGYIKLQSGNRISDRQYLVVKKLDATVRNIRVRKEGSKSFQSFYELFDLLPDKGSVSYTDLFGKTKLLGGPFKEVMKSLQRLGVLKLLIDEYMPRNHRGTYEVIESKYREIKLLVDKKNTLEIKKLIDESKPFKSVVSSKPEVKKVSKIELSQKYMKTSDYKKKIRDIKDFDAAYGRSELVKKSKVSKGTISLLLNEKYPNPQRMINTIYERLGLGKQILGVDVNTHELKDAAKILKEIE